jgi:NAD(P)H-dependent FMN reductase
MGHITPSASNEMDVDLPLHSEDNENSINTARVAKLRDLANKVDAFVSGKGDVEGALFDE